MHVKRRNGVKLCSLSLRFFLLFFLYFGIFFRWLFIKHAIAWQLWSGRTITLATMFCISKYECECECQYLFVLSVNKRENSSVQAHIKLTVFFFTLSPTILINDLARTYYANEWIGEYGSGRTVKSIHHQVAHRFNRFHDEQS